MYGRDPMEKALDIQTAQETQVRDELMAFMGRICDEYSLTAYQIVGLLEDLKSCTLSRDGLFGNEDEEDDDDFMDKLNFDKGGYA